MYFLFYVVFNVLQKNEYMVFGFQLRSWVQWSFAFVIGMFLYAYRFKIQLNIWYLALGWVAALCLYRTPVFVEVFVVAWSYSVFFVAFNTQWFARQYNKLGDYSYGLYIYAFPTQEILAHLYKGISPAQMIILALPVALVPAVLSWHVIEQPCILRKKEIASRLSQACAKLSGKFAKYSPK